jgi:mono/diheme cytochrome c family protein
MNSSLMRTIFAALVLAAVLGAGFYLGRRPADAPPPQAQTESPPPARTLAEEIPGLARDPYQRSLKIYEFKKAADSGADRGREIFYYKCWFCHNEFAGPKSAPDLATVFQRKQLLSGRATTDDGIKDEIRNGGAGMAAYKFVLDDADLNDLVAYLHSGCCWNSKRTPPNPRYPYAQEAGE